MDGGGGGCKSQFYAYEKKLGSGKVLAILIAGGGGTTCLGSFNGRT